MLNTALLCFVLFTGQFFAVVHSAEHHFHQEEISCDVFSTVERSGSAVFYDAPTVTAESFQFIDAISMHQVFSHTALSAHQVRAPPFS